MNSSQQFDLSIMLTFSDQQVHNEFYGKAITCKEEEKWVIYLSQDTRKVYCEMTGCSNGCHVSGST